MAPRLLVVGLLLVLFSGCATARVVRLDTGQGAPLEYRPPAPDKSVRVVEDEFERSLSLLALSVPLALHDPQQGWFVRASYPSDAADLRWQHLKRKGYFGLCAASLRTDRCASLLDDVSGLNEWEKFGAAFILSLDPLKDSVARAVEKTLAPQLFFAIISTAVVSWAVLAANPEPLFTKTLAVVSALLLIYLGVEVFLEVVDAIRELKRDTDRATTAEELNQAGHRYANRVGPPISRVIVLAVTTAVCQGMVGGAAWTASWAARTLPNFPDAGAAAAMQLGITLEGVGQVSAVSVVGGNVIISLPAGAVSMAAAQGQGEDTTEDEPTGQLHHIISKRIFEKLQDHPTLKGHYTERDSRFVTRAANKDAHNGYQTWHRDVEQEIIKWLEKYDNATPEEFEAFLREIYSRPEMRARFPNGF